MPPRVKGRNREVSGFFVDMNKLFEMFIEKALAYYALSREYRLTTNRDEENKLEIFNKKPSNSKLRSQYPDYILWRADRIIVTDAKYRKIIGDSGEDRGKILITPDMARQLYVYSKILEDQIRKTVRR